MIWPSSHGYALIEGEVINYLLDSPPHAYDLIDGLKIGVKYNRSLRVYREHQQGLYVIGIIILYSFSQIFGSTYMPHIPTV